MSALNEIVSTLQKAGHEGTESPYWLILDPRQMFRCDVHELGSMITGPFFSRKDAEDHLKSRSYNFSNHARVYCHSGYYSYKYKMLCREINAAPNDNAEAVEQQLTQQGSEP